MLQSVQSHSTLLNVFLLLFSLHDVEYAKTGIFLYYVHVMAVLYFVKV